MMKLLRPVVKLAQMLVKVLKATSRLRQRAVVDNALQVQVLQVRVLQPAAASGRMHSC